MSPEKTDDEKQVPESAADAKQVEAISKQSFRNQVWESLQKSRLLNFPRPAYGRIPNFKGANLAAAKLLELDEFRSAKSVEINPDKSLESCRILAVEHDKTLYVPIPRLQKGLLKELSFGEDEKPKNVQQSVTRLGIETFGKSVDFDDKVHIELFVVGSVAVSREGRRIGKGKGYTDLDYAVLKEMNAIDDDTIIVTIVHESQVFDTLPTDIFEKFDVPIDYILTPTEIIKVEKRLPRPNGIYWNLLSQRRVNLIPILQRIKKNHESTNRDTTLNEVDTDVEVDEKRIQRRKRRYMRRKPKSDKENGSNNDENNAQEDDSQKPRTKRRSFRRKRALKERLIDDQNRSDPETHKEKDSQEGGAGKRRPKSARRASRRYQVDFSLIVSNIDKNVRVRHLKTALIDRGIKPNNITWRGYKGFCYLHYAKPAPKKDDEVEQTPESFAMDNVIEILQGLQLSPDSEANLNVKVMEPITRVETTDVTTV